MTEPRPAKKLRDYIPLHESINRGPLLLALALFALAGIVAAIVSGHWLWLLVSVGPSRRNRDLVADHQSQALDRKRIDRSQP
jgi:hypothetical protein